MMSMWRPRYFAVVSRHEKVPTAPHMSAMPMRRARRALAASRACTADSVFMCVAACRGITILQSGASNGSVAGRGQNSRAGYSGKLREAAVMRTERMAGMSADVNASRLPGDRAFVPPAQQEMGDERQREEDRDPRDRQQD